MRRSDFNSDAEYYRAHRKVFLLAQELGCTPVEAEAEMKRQESHMHYLATQARLEAKMNAPLIPGFRSGHDPEERPTPWYQRD